MQEYISMQTRIRTDNSLGNLSNKPSIDKLREINKEIDISEHILAELEPFILTLMNVEFFRFDTNIHTQNSHISRNGILQELKKGFIQELREK